MKLYECQAKRIFEEADISVPKGEVAESAKEAEEIADKIGPPVVVKAQVHAGGRGEAGGIKSADTPKEARGKANEILGMELKGEKVRKVLVEELLDIDVEYFVGFTTDRSVGEPVAIISSRGGVDVEEVAEGTPERVAKENINPIWGIHDFKARELAFKAKIADDVIQSVSDVAKNLYGTYVEKDASLAEINPLVLTKDGNLVAADAVLVVDDNALYRHPELAKIKEELEIDPIVRRAHKYGFDYVRLDGSVGIIGNGAGLVMATLDLVKHFGGRPANFLDVGGGASSDTVENALDLILKDPNVEAVLFNIFGGITRCDEVARGINEAIKGIKLPFPIIVKLSGTNEEEGLEILNTEKVEMAKSLEEAVKKGIELSGGE